MKKSIDLEFRFFDKQTYSIDIKYPDMDLDYYSYDQFILIAYIIRQIVTIGVNHPVSKNIINTLYNPLPYPDIDEVIVAAFDEKGQENNELFEKVNPNKIIRVYESDKKPIRKIIFKTEYEVNKNIVGEGWFKQDNEGFGLLGYGINYFLPISIYLLINYFIERKTKVWDAMGEKWDDKSLYAWRLLIRTDARISCRELSTGKINLTNSLRASYMIYLALTRNDLSYLGKY